MLIIITHFDKYSLITQKQADFLLFKKVINKLVNKEHLILKRLNDIIDISASMNLGLPTWITDPAFIIDNNSFNITPITRPLIESNIIPDPYWMAGFISGEGSFSIVDGTSISLSFRVSQYSKDEELLKSFVNYFECGNFNYHHKDKKAVIYVVIKFEDINSLIITFF